MKITNFEKKENIINFRISGVDVKYLNALRRAIISEVPTMAIEKVTFYENSSILDDEILAHRLGLLPLKTDLKTYNFIGECTCRKKGCGKCTAILTIDVKGPKTVYASDITSTDKNILPAYGKTPLVKITKDQGLKIEAVAQLGRGKDHIKWQAGLAAYEQNSDGSYNFILESFGSLTVNELLLKAFGVIKEKISELKDIKLD